MHTLVYEDIDLSKRATPEENLLTACLLVPELVRLTRSLGDHRLVVLTIEAANHLTAVLARIASEWGLSLCGDRSHHHPVPEDHDQCLRRAMWTSQRIVHRVLDTEALGPACRLDDVLSDLAWTSLLHLRTPERMPADLSPLDQAAWHHVWLRHEDALRRYHQARVGAELLA
jgi:hypothetical protein